MLDIWQEAHNSSISLTLAYMSCAPSIFGCYRARKCSCRFNPLLLRPGAALSPEAMAWSLLRYSKIISLYKYIYKLFWNIAMGSNWIDLKCSSPYVFTRLQPKQNNHEQNALDRLSSCEFLDAWAWHMPRTCIVQWGHCTLMMICLLCAHVSCTTRKKCLAFHIQVVAQLSSPFTFHGSTHFQCYTLVSNNF